MINLVKKTIMNGFFSKGRNMTIWRGPLKGYKYIVKPDTGFSSLLGRWEKDSQVIYINSIFKGNTVFDLGANFGIHAMLYSKLVGPEGKVFAFEPLPSNIADLEAHKKMNGINNIFVQQSAVSNEISTQEFKIASHGGQGSLVGIGRETGTLLQVKTDTLDHFCTVNNVLPDFIKIDIEGAEGFALQGFNEKVKASYPFFAIDLHTPECDRQAGNFLSTHGYEVYRVIKASGQTPANDRQILKRIELLNEPYPHPQGIWGVIWAVHPSRKHQVAAFINNSI